MSFTKRLFFLFFSKINIFILFSVIVLSFIITPCFVVSAQSFNQNKVNIKKEPVNNGSVDISSGGKAPGSTAEVKNPTPADRGGANPGAENLPPDPAGAKEEGGGVPAYEFKAPTFEETKISYPVLVLKTVAVLAVIVISIFILFKILVKGKGKIISDSEVIRVLATYSLSANKVIQIVDIGGKVLVLGVTDSNINLITTIEDKEVIDAIKLQYSKEKAQKAGFKDQFTKLLGGKIFNKMGQISYLDNYRKRIKKMKKL